MGGDYLSVDCWPEKLSTSACTTKGTQQVSKDLLWEDLLDYSEIEAEEDFLQQHIALLMVPYMQYHSLKALSAPDNDLLVLTDTGLWDPLRKGLMFCLNSNDKQIIVLATKLIVNVHSELNKAGYYECIGQLVCSFAHAAEQAASMRQCVAIWEPCMPIVKAVAHQLPQTCMYYTEAVLGNIAEAFCSLLRMCMESNHALLQKSLTSNNDNDCSMRWWHSWLARAKIAKVLPDCLMGSKLLHQALGTVVLAARGQHTTSAYTLLLGVHVVTGALSLSRVRKLFPIDTSAKQMHQVSLEGALQALITIFTSLPPLPNTTTPSSLATSGGEADPNPAIQTLLPSVPSEVCVAAVQGLQSLALQQSSKGHHIFSPANVQQLLQPSLTVLAQQYKIPQAVKGSLAPGEGKNGVAERERRSTVGKFNGTAGVGDTRMAVESYQRLCTVVGDSWDIVAQLCLTSDGSEVVTHAQVQSRQGNSLNAADVAASLLQCLHSADTTDEAPKAIVRSALGPTLGAVQALVQTSAGYEAIDAAGVPDMLIHHLHTSASKTAADLNLCDMAITTCILSMCNQPLLSLRLSQSPAALQCCAGRLAAQAQHEDQASWLYQASSLTLTEAGQKALLHAGLPQQLLHQLYWLRMQSTDLDTDAMREQQHAKLLHACEVVMSWGGLAEQLVPANVGQQSQLAYHSILQDLCQAALQASPCPLSSSADCPALSTLEGAEAALRLLTAACIPLRCRWVLDSHLNLRHRLQHHVDTQEEEAGVAIIDMTTAPRQQLLSMLQTKQSLTTMQAASPAQPQQYVKQSPGTASLHGQPSISLSKLSVHDPGMKDPQAWLLTVQKALLVGIEQGQLQWKALPLILQRAVMVAMRASSQEGLSPAAPPLQAYHSQQDQERSSHSAAGSKQAAQCPRTSACQPELEAFLTQAKQQMPSLAGRLTAPQLQNFLCSMQEWHQSAMPGSSSTASSIQVIDYFASVIWFIMRGDAVAKEFLAALTDSQASMYLWPGWGQHNSEPAAQLVLSQCFGTMLREELPVLHAMLTQSGVHVGHFMTLWHQQCFVETLDMPDVVLYVTVGVLLGPDWLLYFMLAVLQQQGRRLQQHWVENSTICEALTHRLDFDVQKALPYMERLQAKWSEKMTSVLVKPFVFHAS
ncbi:hypothetical protein WJX77_007663 [Trebouxia sp. C0004]